MSLQELPAVEMRAALRLAVLAVPMGVLLSRTMAWMSSGKTHAELISRLRGNGLTDCLQKLQTLRQLLFNWNNTVNPSKCQRCLNRYTDTFIVPY